MTFPAKPFLEWEIEFYVDYMGGSLFDFSTAALASDAMVRGGYDITINRLRASLRNVAIGPHPDERGELKIYEDHVPKDTDATIPIDKLMFARADLELKNSKLAQGRLSAEDLRAKYQKLYQDTEAGYAAWLAAQGG